MADSTPELPRVDAFAAYDKEIEQLERLFADCDWSRPSRCEGWDTRDVLSHITIVDRYNLACLDDDIPSMAGFNWDAFIDAQRSEEPADLVERWREQNREVRRRWEERGLDNTVASMVGPYSLRAQVFHIGNEIATHADDVHVEVAPEDRAARDDWRAVYTRFALDEYSKPVVVEIDDEVALTLDDEVVKISKADFVDATLDRLEVPLSPAMMRALRLIP